MPDLADPNFARSVVLILEHDADGAVGVILNRPSELSSEPDLPAWSHLLVPPEVVFLGGPVDPDAAVGLARLEGGPGSNGIQLVDLSAEPGELAAPVRVFAGYAGWSSQQLEAELVQGGWIVTGAEAEDVFTSEPKELWRRVVGRQHDRVAMYANFPADPRAN